MQYRAVNKSPCGQASIPGDEGKEVTVSVQYCAVNKSPSGQASITGDEGNRLQVECSIVL